MERKDIREALLRSLEQSRLQGDELKLRLRDALSPDYWRGLNPSLTVAGDGAGEVVGEEAEDPSSDEDLPRRFSEEGYFQIGPLFPDSLMGRMRDATAVLRREGWHPVFAFAYDQFWQVMHAPRLVRLLSAILGPGYKQTSNVWTHYVYPSRPSGWPPHIDNYGKSDRVTVWLALGDATLDNGCMYLVPKNLAPEHVAWQFPHLETVKITDLRTLLQGSRALPARAGAVLGWGPSVIHWGSTGGGDRTPRISTSQEFIGEPSEPSESELPLFEPHSVLPTFSQRLHAIGKAVIAYRKFEPLVIRYADLGEQLIADTEPGRT